MSDEIKQRVNRREENAASRGPYWLQVGSFRNHEDAERIKAELALLMIHNIIGVDRSSGAIGVNGYAKVGTTVQFHVRDAASADEDFRALLIPYANQDVRGAMLFGCNGRGTNMWPKPGHDIGVLREVLGDVPIGGFFCGGEFGPVGGANFVHGFTASIGLFRESY